MPIDLSPVFRRLPERAPDARMPHLAAGVWREIAARHERKRRLRGAVFTQLLAMVIAFSVGLLAGHADAARGAAALDTPAVTAPASAR
jgi:hypothetical protein